MGGKRDLKSVQYLETRRPWLSLYGARIRPVAPVGSVSRLPVNETSLLHRMLPDELLLEVFLHAAPYALGRAACVCRKWRYVIRTPILWRSACLKAWQIFGVEQNELLVQESYRGSWRKMWLERPRLRFDGLYVARNTYIRTGIAEWKTINPVHLVCYYRYIRFYPSGRFLYKTSPNRVRDVAKYIHGHPSKTDAVFGGRYTLTNSQVEAAILYPGVRPTVLRIRLRIRGTTGGANNRMDLLSLVTSGVGSETAHMKDEDVLGAVEGWEEDETHDPNVPAVSHRRGMAAFVFIPFEEVCVAGDKLGLLLVVAFNSGVFGSLLVFLIEAMLNLCIPSKYCNHDSAYALCISTVAMPVLYVF